jgi:hypothetical protein
MNAVGADPVVPWPGSCIQQRRRKAGPAMRIAGRGRWAGDGLTQGWRRLDAGPATRISGDTVRCGADSGLRQECHHGSGSPVLVASS